MKLYKRYIILTLTLMLSFGYGSTEDKPDIVTRVATSISNWLKIETGTRAIGMGGAFTSIGAGLIGIPYNPASLSFVKKQEAFLSTTQYVAGISHNVIGYATNMSGVDFASMHIFFLDSGTMPVTIATYPEGTGEDFSFTALCLRGTYSRIITNRLRIGFTGKFIREGALNAYMQTVAFDIGSHFDTGLYGFKLGMSINNLGPEAKYDGEDLEFTCPDTTPTEQCQKIAEFWALPMTFRLGFSNDIVGPESYFIKSKNHKMMLALDAISPIDYVLYGTAGMEYSFKDMFFLRGGMHFNHDTADFSLGTGLKVNIRDYKFALDYAYVNYGILDFTHQFGLNFEF